MQKQKKKNNNGNQKKKRNNHRRDYLVIGSNKVVQVIKDNGFKEIQSPFYGMGYEVLKGKKCFVKGETYFFVDKTSMMVVRDRQFYAFRGLVTSYTHFENIMNSLPTKFWRTLR